jgi:hypothetical protein
MKATGSWVPQAEDNPASANVIETEAIDCGARSTVAEETLPPVGSRLVVTSVAVRVTPEKVAAAVSVGQPLRVQVEDPPF